MVREDTDQGDDLKKMLPKKILILRFSAMGDVVLLVPVLRSLLAEYPELQISVATRPKFTSFFHHLSSVKIIAADVDKEFKGFSGLWRLFRKLKTEKFDLVIDEHDHLRTKILRTLFFLAGTPTLVFDKGRSDKKKFSRTENKITKPLPHTVERYSDAFKKSGFNFPLLPGPHLISEPDIRNEVAQWLQAENLVKNEPWIGVAPFAMHRSKIWPIENYAKLFRLLLEQKSYRFFLFGGGQKEIDFFNTLKNEFPNQVTIVAGVLKLHKEIALMQKLDLMLCVDSSNMHFATLAGTPILSIWGGTHPDVGFGPFQRNANSIIQISPEELTCRPCSVYGKETCARGDFACMTRITPQLISNRVMSVLNLKS
ncbi:lipopolysaccharide heptosyltransferase family protein [Chryseotalea sanaruensis]|uniref:Lipopolysaccharide heptosyltransferase family protein n=1 Tax=Chryseotalea sanaruensis TaxID=2482724 RepID=A0A401UCE5_9BACT|nr:glycosyltransferase family 9 protein [Chryseotalea sanaruensis]GCC52555.1 lipopolysaccharide heptosyltransferase family protein [Chryseotalea sanaruensis]